MRNPPLVFVLSEKYCSMLLFPFIDNDNNDLVECVLLPEIPIWANKVEEGALLNRHLLVVMLLLCGGHGEDDEINYLQYKYVYPSGGTKKSEIKKRIQTVRENITDLLQKSERKRQEESVDAEMRLKKVTAGTERKLKKMTEDAGELQKKIDLLESQAKV